MRFNYGAAARVVLGSGWLVMVHSAGVAAHACPLLYGLAVRLK